MKYFDAGRITKKDVEQVDEDSQSLVLAVKNFCVFPPDES